MIVLADQRLLKNVEVEYVTIPGWKTSTKDCKTFEELPSNAQAYVKKIEEIVGVKGTYDEPLFRRIIILFILVQWIGVGPGRDSIIQLF